MKGQPIFRSTIPKCYSAQIDFLQNHDSHVFERYSKERMINRSSLQNHAIKTIRSSQTASQDSCFPLYEYMDTHLITNVISMAACI